MTTEQEKFFEIKTYHSYKKIGDDLDYAVIVSDNSVILQFQESISKTDWKNNFSFLPCRLKICDKHIWTTKGYARAYSDIPIDEFKRACEEFPEYTRIIRGWSFGSAMAKIASVHFTQDGKKLDELTTFGDVKCFLKGTLLSDFMLLIFFKFILEFFILFPSSSIESIS